FSEGLPQTTPSPLARPVGISGHGVRWDRNCRCWGKESVSSLLAARWPLGLCGRPWEPCGGHLHGQAQGHSREPHVHLPRPREESG
ncbi:hypothetical protein PSU44_21030, partial [Yersinia pestis]|nr:hypothetical protein [Yersinia pestis]